MAVVRYSAFLVVLCLALPAAAQGQDQEPTVEQSDAESPDQQPSEGEIERPTVAFVTNMVAQFWRSAEVGAVNAGEEFNAEVIVYMPPIEDRVRNQQQKLEELLAMGVAGIAISPCDPESQTEFLSQVADSCSLITHDFDAPDSNRLCYIGMNNYQAGVACGRLVKEALPEGGTIAIFVGSARHENARLRRQGLIDEVLGREYDETRYYEPDATITSPADAAIEYVILPTRTDNFDLARARSLVSDTLASSEVDCMVGLFEYNVPAILHGVQDAGRIEDIKIVGFDDNEDTLQAIVDGECHGTIVQNPYEYGYQSVRMLAALARGDESVLPENGVLEIEPRAITADNVESYWEELKRMAEDY